MNHITCGNCNQGRIDLSGKKVGEKLRLIRENLKISRLEVRRQLKISEPTMYWLENSKGIRVNLELVKKLCDYYKVKVDDVL